MIALMHPYEGLAAILVDTAALTTTSDRDTALEGGVVDLVRSLTASAHESQDRVALDVRTDGADPLGAKEAIVEAVRGLVQGYTAESGSSIPPVNVVVSHAAQVEDRAATWRFLADASGGLARGATFDLRTERP